jgi:hypothetical protein
VSGPGRGEQGGPDRAWAPSPARLPACGHHHRAAGRLDEAARRLDHPELAAAKLLVSEGHTVRTLAAKRGSGPTADFDVCGTPVEVKTLVPQAERPGGRPANDRSVFNRLVSGVDQAPVTLVMAQGSGLRPADAAAGLSRFSARAQQGRTRAVRCVGDGWDLSWRLGRAAERPAGRQERDRRRSTGLDPGPG